MEAIKAICLAAAFALVMQGAVPGSACAADQASEAVIGVGDGGTPAPSSSGTSSDFLTRETLSGDWGGSRTWLKERGVTIKPRLTQYYQGLSAGDGDHGYEYGGKGLVPRRSRDNWGVGYYYDSFSQYLKDALAPAVTLRDEQGLELFYNLAISPSVDVGADLQVIKPGLADSTAVFPGLRVVIRL